MLTDLSTKNQEDLKIYQQKNKNVKKFTTKKIINEKINEQV